MSKTQTFTNIPVAAWVTINKRVSIILASSWGGEYYKPLEVLPNYQQLYSVCERWKASTFNQLGIVAAQMATTAEKHVRLIRAICPAGAWQVARQDIPRLKTDIATISAELRHLRDVGAPLQREVDAFVNAQLQADVVAICNEWESQ